MSRVPVELVRPLRGTVLRPGLPALESVYPGDDDPSAVHAAVRLGRAGADDGAGADGSAGSVVAVGSLLAEAPPDWLTAWPGVPDVPGVTGPGGRRWWRIRGMATAEPHRGAGLGQLVLDLLLEGARSAGGGVAWCNARVPALSFYLRAGFTVAGGEFDLPLIGPHRTMWRTVAPA